MKVPSLNYFWFLLIFFFQSVFVNAQTKLYWANNKIGILSAYRDGSDLDTLVHTVGAEGIAVSHEIGKIYWINRVEQKIARCNLDGSDIEDLVTNEEENTIVTVPRSIVLDVQNNYMYWTERFLGGRINRARLDGSEPEVLLNNLNSQPEGIAIDKDNQYVYYTVQGDTGIERFKVNTSGYQRLFSTFGLTDQIAIDLDSQKIYRFNKGSFGVNREKRTSIIRSDYYGFEVDTLYSVTNYRQDNGLALDLPNEKIYWMIDSTIQRANLDGSEVEDVISGHLIQSGYGGYLTFGDTHSYTRGQGGSDEYCEDVHLEVYNPHLNDGTFWGISFLSSSAHVSDGAEVNYKAVKRVQLLPGFHAQAGSKLTVAIESCNLMPIPEPASDIQFINQVESERIYLSIFPNPASKMVNFNWRLPEANSAHLSLFNLSGQLVKSFLLHQILPEGNHQYKAEVSDLPTGVYLVVLKLETQVIVEKLFVN